MSSSANVASVNTEGPTLGRRNEAPVGHMGNPRMTVHEQRISSDGNSGTVPTEGLRPLDGNNGRLAYADHAFSDAAHDHAAHTGSSTCTHDDKVNVLLVSAGKDFPMGSTDLDGTRHCEVLSCGILDEGRNHSMTTCLKVVESVIPVTDDGGAFTFRNDVEHVQFSVVLVSVTVGVLGGGFRRFGAVS